MDILEKIDQYLTEIGGEHKLELAARINRLREKAKNAKGPQKQIYLKRIESLTKHYSISQKGK